MEVLEVPLYFNAIEPLVAEEVRKQIEQLPSNLARYYVNRAEAIAYALNRLPAMYVTSEEGWRRQEQLAKEQMSLKIFLAVRQGLAAVYRDPLRVSTPLSWDVVREKVEKKAQELPSCS